MILPWIVLYKLLNLIDLSGFLDYHVFKILMLE